MKNKKDYKPTLLLDFDGVIHSYVSGWKGVDVIPDPPVVRVSRKKGTTHLFDAIDWVTHLIKSGRFVVCIYSSRSKDRKGLKAMKGWFLDCGMSRDVLDELEFPTKKPAAFLTIDDRAITFTGEFIMADKLASFKTWQGK